MNVKSFMEINIENSNLCDDLIFLFNKQYHHDFHFKCFYIHTHKTFHSRWEFLREWENWMSFSRLLWGMWKVYDKRQESSSYRMAWWMDDDEEEGNDILDFKTINLSMSFVLLSHINVYVSINA